MEKQKPNDKSESVDAEIVSEAPPTSSDLLNELLSKISEKDMKKAEALGIPIFTLIKLSESMVTENKAIRAEMDELKTSLPDAVKKKMTEAFKEAQTQQMQQVQKAQGQAPQGGGGGLLGGMAELAPIAKELFGGGASNPLQDKMNTFMSAVLDQALERMMKPSRFEAVLDEELIKAKAKALAAVVSSP